MPNPHSTLPIDEQLLNKMIENAGYDLASFARTSGLDREDLRQEVTIKIIQRWEKIMACRTPLAYTRRVVRNHLIDIYHQAIQDKSMSMNVLEEQGVQF